MNTFDLDVVYQRSAPNIERLLQALDELDAIVRDDSCHSADDDELNLVLGEDADQVSERHLVHIAQLRPNRLRLEHRPSAGRGFA